MKVDRSKPDWFKHIVRKKTSSSFWTHFYAETTFLPRQAWDKRVGKVEERRRFLGRAASAAWAIRGIFRSTFSSTCSHHGCSPSSAGDRMRCVRETVKARFCVSCLESSWCLSFRACLDKPLIFRLQLLGSCTQRQTPWFSPVGVSHNVGNDPRLPGIPPLPGAKRVVLFLVLLKRTLRNTIASLARQARDKPTQETFENGATFLLSKTVRWFLLTGPSCELQHVRSGGGGYADG
jgi:hypothetical protein